MTERKLRTDDGRILELYAWHVEFESGEVELWMVSELDGPPAFGESVTPLYRIKEKP